MLNLPLARKIAYLQASSIVPVEGVVPKIRETIAHRIVVIYLVAIVHIISASLIELLANPALLEARQDA